MPDEKTITEADIIKGIYDIIKGVYNERLYETDDFKMKFPKNDEIFIEVGGIGVSVSLTQTVDSNNNRRVSINYIYKGGDMLYQHCILPLIKLMRLFDYIERILNIESIIIESDKEEVIKRAVGFWDGINSIQI